MSGTTDFLKNSIATRVARYATDAAGNVTGLVGPDGARIQVLETLLTAYDTYNPPSDLSWLSLRSKTEWTDVLVESPYSPGHILHPSLCHIKSGFAGYRFWLAYTPYPDSDSSYENPCIAASNDLVNWDYPATNPIIPDPGGSYYNSDCELYYDEPAGRLVMLWRATEAVTTLKIVTSQDGITWTSPTVIYTAANPGTATSTDIASPSIWYNSTTSKWEIVGVVARNAGTARPIVKITSDSLLSGWDTSATWTVLTMTPPSGRAWWHGQMRRLSSGALIGIYQDNAVDFGSGYLYAVYSADGVTFGYKFLERNYVKNWYRPSFTLLQDPSSGEIFVYVMGSTLGEARLFGQVMAMDAELFSSDRTGPSAAILSAAGLGNVKGILHADTFNRADDATGLGTSTSGHTYTQTGSAPTVIGISGNRAYPVNGATGNHEAYVDIGVTDCVIRMILAEKTDGLSNWMLLRFVDSNNKVRIGIGSPIAQLTYQVITGGAVATTALLGITPAAGDELRVSVIGNQFRIYLNDLFIAKKTCNQGLTATKFGMALNGVAMKIDNFSITQI